MKILLLFLMGLKLAHAQEDSYLAEQASLYPYVRQLVELPLAKWPNHDLGGQVINYEGAYGLARAIIQNKDLKALCFKHCELTDMTVSPILLSLVNHPAIEKIDISFNQFGKETFKLLVKVIQNNMILKSLDVSMSSCAYKGAEKLFGAVLKSPTIREFIFDFNLLSVDTLQPLLQLKEPNRSLERLSFKVTSFSSKALKEFAFAACNLKALKVLDLSSNHVTNDDAKSLAQLVYNCPCLEELVLVRNQMDLLFPCDFLKEWMVLTPNKSKKNLTPLTIYLSCSPKKGSEPVHYKGEVITGSRLIRFV